MYIIISFQYRSGDTTEIDLTKQDCLVPRNKIFSYHDLSYHEIRLRRTKSIESLCDMTLTKLPTNGKVGIIGAGILGLSYAYFITKLRPDINITIFESQNRPGGYIHTTQLDDNGNMIKLEKGPRTLRGVSEGTLLILDMLIQNGKKDQIMAMKSDSVANRKFLLDSAYNLVPVPHSTKSFIEFLGSELNPKAFFKLLKEPFVKKGENIDESIEHFFKRRLGTSALTDKVASAIMNGIYAGDISKLSVNSIFPTVKALEQNLGSFIKPMIESMFKKKPPQSLAESLNVYSSKISPSSNLEKLRENLKGFPIVSLKDSLAVYPQLVYDVLKLNNKVSIKYNSEITEVDPQSGTIAADSSYQFDHIRSTINVNTLGSLIKSNELNHALNSIEYVNLFMANIYTKNKRLIPRIDSGFGFLVPKSSKVKEQLLGVIYDSDIRDNVLPLYNKPTDNRDESTILTVMMGGHMYDSGVPSSGVSLNAVKSSLRKVFHMDESANIILRDEANCHNDKVDLKPDDILISYNLHANCIPQYHVGYGDIKKQVETMLQGTKLSLGGMCFGRGVGVPDCVLNSLEAAIEQ